MLIRTFRREFVKHSVYILEDLQFISSRNRFCLLCKITHASYETGYNNNILPVQAKVLLLLSKLERRNEHWRM